MYRLLFLAVVFMTCLTLGHNTTIEYNDCPKACTCQSISVALLVRCNSLIQENELTKLPVMHFEIRDAIQPIAITNELFVKMGLADVNSVIIQNSTVTVIEEDAFKGLNVLRYLKISQANLTQLHPKTFIDNSHLKKISLSENPLNISSLFLPESVEEIDISYCNITNFESTMLLNQPEIIFLDLSGNNIETLKPGSFDQLTDIEELNLSHNKLKKISTNIFSNNLELDTLDLSHNPLTSFSGKEFPSLETLKLGSCLLNHINDDMLENVSELIELDLSNNKITKIDVKAFSKLSKLSTIDLSGNDLQTIDENIFVRNSLLKVINLDNNMNLNQLPENGFQSQTGSFPVYHFSCNNCNLQALPKGTFSMMPAMVDLSLSHNKISDVSTGVFQTMTSLIELYLSYNEISTIDDNTFEHNPNLNTLSLSNNHLKSLHVGIFSKTSNLKYLDLSNCSLYKLWTGPRKDVKLSSILSLNISNNKLSIIDPEDISITDQLKTIDISQNPIGCSESLQKLVLYLHAHDIKNGQYITHEKQSYDFNKRQNDEFSWINLALTNCPNLYHLEEELLDDENLDLDDELNDEDIDNGPYTELKDVDSQNYDVSEQVLLLSSERHRYYRYSYIWPILVFIGSALAVLGVVVNVILFIIRRRQALVLPRIINVRSMSKLKKNSGLVYQQLSEEHGPKTPIFSRFTTIPSVHTITNQNGEHV